MFTMKHLLLTTIAAVLLVGCGTTQSHKSAILKPAEPVSEVAPPANPTADRALFDAAKAGNIEAVKQHLDAGADVNAKDGGGWTPLHYAAGNSHKEIAELLIAKGADVNAKNDKGRTPLHRAAIFGHKEIVELLIAKGADMNATEGGWTPLHDAAQLNRKEITELLIANGADVNAKEDEGATPLDVAIRLKQTETADLLRKHGGKTGAELGAEGK